LTPTLPAVTASVQATLTTGTTPQEHGIIANGVPTFRSKADQALVDASNFAEYRRNVSFWEQSNQFLEVPRFWQDAHGQNRVKTALLFFQNCMPGFSGTPRPAADIVLTPKPDHGPDGKLTSLCWSNPPALVPELFKELGPFPLMHYWGPMAGAASSQWIARAAARIWQTQHPELQLVYVPHLDYDLQRFGPSSPQARQAVVDLSGALEPLLEAVTAEGGQLVLLSEYAMRDVTHFIQPTRLLTEAGLLQTRATADGAIVDYAASAAFAMVDHQVAHVYTRDAEATAEAREQLGGAGVRLVGREEMQAAGLNHRRSGDLLLIAPEEGWFDYRWWNRPEDAPVFAKMVDIHRKSGYDPAELFFDPATMGVSLNPALVRGSHGRVEAGEAILAGPWAAETPATVDATDVGRMVMELMGEG
jgi:predicted AlkP superfamily pyrophosphatase or phosphodiesterase